MGFVDGCMHMRGPAAGIDVQCLRFETRLIHRRMRDMQSSLRSFQATAQDAFANEAVDGENCHVFSSEVDDGKSTGRRYTPSDIEDEDFQVASSAAAQMAALQCSLAVQATSSRELFLGKVQL